VRATARALAGSSRDGPGTLQAVPVSTILVAYDDPQSETLGRAADYAEQRLGEYWAWKREVDGSRKAAGEEMPLREKRWAQEA